jgi:hypothetical protein
VVDRAWYDKLYPTNNPAQGKIDQDWIAAVSNKTLDESQF